LPRGSARGRRLPPRHSYRDLRRGTDGRWRYTDREVTRYCETCGNQYTGTARWFCSTACMTGKYRTPTSREMVARIARQVREGRYTLPPAAEVAQAMLDWQGIHDPIRSIRWRRWRVAELRTQDAKKDPDPPQR